MTVAMSSPAEGARRTVLAQRPHTEMRAAIADTGAELASRHRARLMRRVAQSKSLARVPTFSTGGDCIGTIVLHGLSLIAAVYDVTKDAVEVETVPKHALDASGGDQTLVPPDNGPLILLQDGARPAK